VTITFKMDFDSEMREVSTSSSSSSTDKDMKEILHRVVDDRVHKLYSLWNELGLDSRNKRERNATIEKYFEELLDRMVEEEYAAKKKILDSLEVHTKKAFKLCKELGMTFEAPDSSLVLVQYEQAVRHEAQRLGDIKEERMKEVKGLKRKDEKLCDRLAMDPFYVSSSTVPTTEQLHGLKDHIRMLEEVKFTRLEEFVKLKENILTMYNELEAEPVTELEREIACEDPDRFTLSERNLSSVSSILNSLEERNQLNKRTAMEAVEKIDSLYERLELDKGEKVMFLSQNEGHSPSILHKLHLEIARLEEIKKANIEKFVTKLRNDLHKCWNDCFYSTQQRNSFEPLHCVEFTEELLELHEAELAKLKAYFEDNKELLIRVGQRQEVWKKAMELERRAKDPSRLMNARGNSLLMEEKERNKVNKTLPRLEQELEELIADWEKQHGRTFLVGGVSFTLFLQQQREEHASQLEAEKQARDQAKKKTLHQETMFGAKPATPAKLKISGNSTRTPRKVPGTPGSTFTRSRLAPSVGAMRSPRGGRITKGASPRLGVGGKRTPKTNTSIGLNRSSKIIKRGAAKSANPKATANKAKLKRGVLADQTNNSFANETVIRTRAAANLSVASTVPDYADFKKGTPLNSTVKGTPDVSRASGRSDRTPNYMTPTKSSVFRTPTGPGSRSRLGTPQSKSNKLSTLRSGANLPFLF